MDLFDLQVDFKCGKDKDNCWVINPDLTQNYIEINKEDFFLGYIDPNIKGKKKNKGGNSIVYLLYNAQAYDESFSIPDKVIKIAEQPNKYRNGNIDLKNNRFKNEIEALCSCKSNNFQNVISLECAGHIINNNLPKNNFHPFYIMEYADCDLKQYIDKTNLSLEEKIVFCLQIAYGLQQLEKLGLYHRDLKPDNIFFVNDIWKIGDLGLVDFRNKDFQNDCKGIIGPRGWLSPEAMNKYLTNDTTKPHSFDCNIDHQSDIFQLGKVFWYIIQGNAPIGCVRTIDFFEKNTEIYALLKTMLNHSKKKRYKHIDEVIIILKRILEKL